MCYDQRVYGSPQRGRLDPAGLHSSQHRCGGINNDNNNNTGSGSVWNINRQKYTLLGLHKGEIAHERVGLRPCG